MLVLMQHKESANSFWICPAGTCGRWWTGKGAQSSPELYHRAWLCAADLSGEDKFSFMESGIQIARLVYQGICSMMGKSKLEWSLRWSNRAAKECVHLGIGGMGRYGVKVSLQSGNEQVSHWMDSPGLQKIHLNNKGWDKTSLTEGLLSPSLLLHNKRNGAK